MRDPTGEEPLDARAGDRGGESATGGAPAAGSATANAAAVEALIVLIDRLEPLLERSGLAELEVGAGSTTIVLRSPGAIAPAPAEAVIPDPGVSSSSAADTRTHAVAEEPPSGLRPVMAPLTGVFYLSPSPGAAPYVKIGSEVIAGQVIGLLEAMKLFNEIKSDVTGVVRRIAAEHGALVKTRQTLIEVEPT